MDIGRQINQGSGSTYNETHIHHIIINSTDYQALVADIEDMEAILNAVTDDAIRLRQSAKLEEKKAQLEQMKQEVFKLYETFSRISIDTERLRKAKEHFEKGEFREADAILKVEDMTGDLDRLIEREEQLESEREEIQKVREQIANEFLVKAQLTSTFYDDPNWFDKTQSYFESSLQALKTVEGASEYAFFLMQNRQFDRSIAIYEGLANGFRQLVQENESDFGLFHLAAVLGNLGELYMLVNELHIAKPIYEESFAIVQRLVYRNRRTYFRYYLVCLNNYAAFLAKIGEIALAEEYFKEVVGVVRLSNDEDNKDSLLQLSFNLNNIAMVLLDKGEYGKALQCYNEALTIRRTHGRKDASDRNNLAATLSGMGKLYATREQFSQAMVVLEEALEIGRDLACLNPSAYLPHLGIILFQLADVKRVCRFFDEAEELLKEALKIYDNLMLISRSAYLPDWTNIVEGIAALNHERGRKTEAEQGFLEVLGFRRQISNQYPLIYLPELAGTLYQLGSLYESAGKDLESIECYEESLTIYKSLPEDIVGRNQRIMFFIIIRLGQYYFHTECFEEAKNYFEQGIEWCGMLSVEDPEVYIPMGAAIGINLADTLLISEEVTYAEALHAISLLKTAVRILWPIRQTQPEFEERANYAVEMLRNAGIEIEDTLGSDLR